MEPPPATREERQGEEMRLKQYRDFHLWTWKCDEDGAGWKRGEIVPYALAMYDNKPREPYLTYRGHWVRIKIAEVKPKRGAK